MSQSFNIIDTPIPGLNSIQRKPIGDRRGFLERLFCADELRALLSGNAVVQINHTFTIKLGTVRGMHFQHPPYAEIKFVSCLRGAIFDVAVDLRSGSRAFLQWHGEILSDENHKTLVIPAGFAHGFQTLTENCEMLYFHTAPYQPNAEGGLNPHEPKLAIKWPIAIVEMSARDIARPFLKDDFAGLVV